MPTTYLDFAARGKNSWPRYAGAIALALILTLVITVALTTTAFMLQWVDPGALADPLNAAPDVFFAVIGASFAIMLVSFAAAIMLVHKKRLTDVVGAWDWRAFALGFAVWFALASVFCALTYAMAPSAFVLNPSPAGFSLVALGLAAFGVQTFAEEFVFRGYLNQGLLLATRNEMAAALISGALFGVMHIPNGWPQAFGAAGMGVVFALIAMRTGSIAIPYGIHLANNLFASLVVVSANDILSNSPGVFLQDAPDMIWWDISTTFVALAVVFYLFTRSPRPSRS